MTDIPYKLAYEQQLQLYQRLESYQYFQLYIESGLLAMKTKYTLSDLNPGHQQALTNFTITADSTFNHKLCKIMEFEDDLKAMLEDTIPNYQDLHMPYPIMFINKKFYIDKFIINGFLLIDREYLRKAGFEVQDDAGENIRLLCVMLNTDLHYEFFSVEGLEEKRAPGAKDYFDNTQEYKDMKKAAKLVSKIACNFIQTINNAEKEIEIININYTNEHKQKRIQRGKPALRDKIILRLGGKLKRYAHYYSEHRRTIHTRFLVKGFYRHFTSDKYTNVKGQKKWIYPYWKGQENLPEDLRKFVEIKIADVCRGT